jgi:hypothetical protein
MKQNSSISKAYHRLVTMVTYYSLLPGYHVYKYIGKYKLANWSFWRNTISMKQSRPPDPIVEWCIQSSNPSPPPSDQKQKNHPELRQFPVNDKYINLCTETYMEWFTEFMLSNYYYPFTLAGFMINLHPHQCSQNDINDSRMTNISIQVCCPDATLSVWL